MYDNIINKIDLLDSACKNVGLDDCSSSSEGLDFDDIDTKDNIKNSDIGFISEVEQVSDDNFISSIIKNISNFDYSNYNFKNTVEKKIFFVTKSNNNSANKCNQKYNQFQDFCIKLQQSVNNEAINNNSENGIWIKSINLDSYY